MNIKRLEICFFPPPPIPEKNNVLICGICENVGWSLGTKEEHNMSHLPFMSVKDNLWNGSNAIFGRYGRERYIVPHFTNKIHPTKFIVGFQREVVDLRIHTNLSICDQYCRHGRGVVLFLHCFGICSHN